MKAFICFCHKSLENLHSVDVEQSSTVKPSRKHKGLAFKIIAMPFVQYLRGE